MIYFYESDNSYKYCKQLQRFTAKATFVQGSLCSRIHTTYLYEHVEYFLFYS